MISKLKGAVGLHSRARAFLNNLGQPVVNALACSRRVGGLSHSAASAAEDGSFPVVLVGSGNVMFGELAGSKSSAPHA